MKCAIFGCKSSNQSKENSRVRVSFFKFPKKKQLCKQWVHLSRRADKFNVSNARVCSKHFEESDINTNPVYEMFDLIPKQWVKPGAVPSLFLYGEKQKTVTARDKRGEVRKWNRAALLSKSPPLSLSPSSQNDRPQDQESDTSATSTPNICGTTSEISMQSDDARPPPILPTEQLQKEYGNNHIITYRLNQDVLENFFGDIRSKGEISNA